jgi:hypothetical protein
MVVVRQQKNSTVGKGVLSQLEKNYLKSKTVDRRTVKTDTDTVKRQLNQKKPEVRRSVVPETFGVLSLCGVTYCYSYSKIKSVTINCSSAWRISNKLSVKSRTHELFVMLPGNTRQYNDGFIGSSAEVERVFSNKQNSH